MFITLQQHLPFTVLKRFNFCISHFYFSVATAPTVYGIETVCREEKPSVLQPLQQHLPFTVCAEGCETAEEQSDDEGRTSQVPERSEGKTKLMR